MEKLSVKQIVIVEGKYDKIKLSSIIDGLIIETDGFRIYKNKEKIELIKRLGKENGIIILTDSDVAGFKLRSFLRSFLNNAEIINIYIPQVKGKEKRKAAPGKENLLGVEGIEADLLRKLIADAVESKPNEDNQKKITGADFYKDGLSGGENAQELRIKLAKKLSLPTYMTTKALLDVINRLMTYDEYKEFIKTLKN